MDYRMYDRWFEDYSSMIYADFDVAFKPFNKFKNIFSFFNKFKCKPQYIGLSLYHAQQGVEKAIKLFLVEMRISSINNLRKWGHYTLISVLKESLNESERDLRKVITFKDKELNKVKLYIKRSKEFLNKLERRKDMIVKIFFGLEDSKKMANIRSMRRKMVSLISSTGIIRSSNDLINHIIDFFMSKINLKDITMLYKIGKKDIDKEISKLNLEKFVREEREELETFIYKVLGMGIENRIAEKIEDKIFRNPLDFYRFFIEKIPRINKLNISLMPLLMGGYSKDMRFSKIIFIFPFETYGRYVEILDGFTTLELIERNRDKIRDCLNIAKTYGNLMYMVSKLFHSFYSRYFLNKIK